MHHQTPTDPRPVIGIAPDLAEPTPGRGRVQAALAYVDAIVRAGGVPVVLAPIVEAIPGYLALCDGFVLTGGDDPSTEPFGEPTHERAVRVHPQRQLFDTALLMALRQATDAPTLGICLGMQMMALTAGGSLNQHMPDDTPTHAQHAGNAVHAIRPVVVGGVGSVGSGGVIGEGRVTSHHRQAVRDPGRLRVIALAPDGIIEAVDDPGRAFFVGVQWHPERSEDGELGEGLFRRLVAAAAARRADAGSGARLPSGPC